MAHIERRVKEAVVSGVLGPGDKLSASQLAAELGVSHIPVREALMSLASSGYIQHRPRVGFFVRPLSSDEIRDIYHWRAILEREAFVLAVPNLTEADITEMRRLADMMKGMKARDSRRDYLALNRDFHFVAFRRAESAQLIWFLDHLWDLAAPYTFAGINSEASHDDHEQLIIRFEARDIAGAVDVMVRHRGKSVDAIERWEAQGTGTD